MSNTIPFTIAETDEEYHARSKSGEFLSSHLLADFRKCPLLYYKKTHGLILEEERPAFLIGRAAHCFILEGREKFLEMFAVGGPTNPKTGKPYGSATKAFAEWAAEQEKPVIPQEDAIAIEILAASVNAHPEAQRLLREGIAEAVVRTNYSEIDCQIRMDWYNTMLDAIIDLKTCDDLTWFEADARRYGYAHQLAFYQSVFTAWNPDGLAVPVYMVAVEKKEPHRTGVWQISQATLDSAATDNETTMELLKHCRANNSWPTGYESVRLFEAV